MLLDPLHGNTVSFPVTDANNMSISMSFDPTRPPPIFFQQPLPSSLSARPPLNYGDPHRLPHHQVCTIALAMELLPYFSFSRSHPMLIYVQKIWKQRVLMIIVIACHRLRAIIIIVVDLVLGHGHVNQNAPIHRPTSEHEHSSSRCPLDFLFVLVR